MKIVDSALTPLFELCKKELGCDTVRISNPCEKMFLIIGFKAHTKDNKDSCWQNEKGERIDFEYTNERVIASGDTEEELWASVKQYIELKKIT